jgi:type II secretory pathway component PulK
MNQRPSLLKSAERGAVMIITLWIVLGITALVLVFARSVRVELRASANQVAALQADTTAKGALQYVLAQLDGSNGTPPDPSLVPSEAVAIGNNNGTGNPTGYFWLLRPPGDNETGYCFGLVAEASKLNLNTATADMLMNLPNMTTDIAASIVNWRSPASAVTSDGASSSYYLALADPYNCKNSPFETVEELLLVEGVTQQLLYGDDSNRNGVLDPNEYDSTLGVYGSNIEAGSNPVDGGWNTMVTAYSSQPGSSAVRTAAVAGTATSTAAAQAQAAAGRTTNASRSQAGSINVNTAQQAVLLCLPGLDQGDVAALTAYRSSAGANLTSIAWVASALPRTKAVQVMSYITVQSYQYSADIVAVSADGRAYRRYRAIVDASASPPAVLYWKDLTYLGWPLDPTILTTLRSGTGLTGTTTVTTGGNPQ